MVVFGSGNLGQPPGRTIHVITKYLDLQPPRRTIALAIVSLFAMTTWPRDTAAQEGEICEIFERRYHVSACYTEGEHDEGDYRLKGPDSDGRMYNQSSGIGSRDRMLH